MTLAQLLLPARHRRAITGLFFGGLLALGIGLFRDYGFSSDEEIQRLTGEVSLLHVFRQLPGAVQQRLLSPPAAALIAQKGAASQLRTYRDRDYGVAFELPAAALEQLVHPADTRAKFLLRHALIFLLSLAGIWAFYTLAARRFSSWRIGLLGALLLVLSPRQFADFFYNSKDAVFMAAFTGAVATAVPFIRQPTWRGALLHALVGAWAIDVRLMGTLVPAATLALVGGRAAGGAYRGRPVLAIASGYCALLAGLVVAMWPFLWEAPLTNFMAAWRAMSHFRATGRILYHGQQVWTTNLPWHYVFVWIGITVPLLYLGLWAVGAAGILWRVGQRRRWLRARAAKWQDVLFLGLGLAPLATVVVLHSVLYNGWRQLYFIYPMLLLVALRGLRLLWHWPPPGQLGRRYWRPALAALVAGSLLVIGGRMARLHPLENLYFNAFAPTPVEFHYETDYGGLGIRSGLDWVVAHDARPQIRVYSTTQGQLVLAHQMMPLTTRRRLLPVPSPAEADYLLDDYYHWQPTPPATPFQVLRADNVHLLDIYKFH